MEKLSEYSETQLATAPQTIGYEMGMLGNKLCLPNASSLNAFDTSGALDSASNQFDNFANELDEIWNSISGILDSAADAWGTKFINLNGEELGLIHPEKFQEYFQIIIDAVNDMKTACLTICSELIETEGSINNLLSQLSANYSDYLADVQRKADLEKAGENKKANKIDLSVYTILDDVDGKWVVG